VSEIATTACQLRAADPAQPRSVLLVGPLPPPSGGMANQTRQLAALLVQEGFEVEVVRNNDDYRPRWIERLRGVRALFRLAPYLAGLWRGAGRADVVHVMANSGWAWHLFAAPAIWIAHLRGVPAVVNYRGGDAERFLAGEAWLIRPTTARAALIVVPSGFLAGVFAKFGIATTIVPNIVDLDAFAPAPALPARPHLVVTRNLEPIYDVATALRAFARFRQRFPEARLSIAGEGPERASLEALARGLRVDAATVFTGRLDNADLPVLYRSASALCNPSRVDNTPISVLEALASGVPVVSTGVGGVPFLVSHDRDALLVPAGDPEAMAAALVRVHTEPGLAARLRDAGQDSVRRFAWQRVRPELLAAYAQARGARR
jgi:glycosyltransferase involved in cell wall biosynthesis